MPRKCCVPNCDGNYKKDVKVSVFRFPKDETFRKKWTSSIKRENFTPNDDSVVCERHFKPGEIQREESIFDYKTGKTLTASLKNPRLNSNAIPSQFPNCPSYFSASTFLRESPDGRRNRLENSSMATAFEDSYKEETQRQEKYTVGSLKELKDKLELINHDDVIHIIQKEKVSFCRIVSSSGPPKIEMSLIINSHLKTQLFFGDIEIKQLGNYSWPSSISSILEIESILDNIKKFASKQEERSKISIVLCLVITLLESILDEDCKFSQKIKFFIEQIKLIQSKRPTYSPELLIFSSLLQSCSSHAYQYLRSSNFLTFPSFSTLRRITNSFPLSPAVEQVDKHFLLYIRQKFSSLAANDKIVALLIDEIHLKPAYDYKGGAIVGAIVGAAIDGSKAANSALVFMVNGIFSQFKDVVHIAPVNAIKADTFFSLTKKTIIGLEHIGFKVICMITDNNAVNKKAMMKFANPPQLSIVYCHPCNFERPLFYLFDSVHLLKSIRNNWLNQRNDEVGFIFPKFSASEEKENAIPEKGLTASFKTLRNLYSLEYESLLKYSYKLSLKALMPSNLERQNVTLVLQVFNEYTVEALKTFGKKSGLPFYEETAYFITLINQWWWIMNVKSPFKGIRLKNEFAKPLTNGPTDALMLLLDKFIDWLEHWGKMPGTNGKLTKETFTALRHTTYAIKELANYCFDEFKVSYILQGKLQTDNLEARFGLYRQLAGAQYNVSVQQIFEGEKKLRLKSLLKMSLPFKNYKIEFEKFDIDMNDMQTNTTEILDIFITNEDIKNSHTYLDVIIYVAGYCCYIVNKRMKCPSCKSLLINEHKERLPDNFEYFKGIDRGSLMCPEQSIVNVLMLNYIITQKLFECNDFLIMHNQRDIVINTTFNYLESEEFFDIEFCSLGHEWEKVIKKIIWSGTNLLLNNLCRRENDAIAQNRNKRKLETFKKS